MTFALLAAIVFLAFLVETTVGFGSTVVAVSLAAQLYPIDFLIAVLLPVNMLLSAYLVARYRGSIAWRLLLTRILPLVLAGLAAGILAVEGTEHGWMKPAFGVLVCLLAVFELAGARRREAAPTRPLSPAAGAAWLLAGGAVHGVYATGGPLIVYYASRQLTDKQAFRATLSLLWLILNFALLVSYALNGRLSAETGMVSVWLLFPLGLGMVAGEWLHGRMDARRFRTFVFVLLFVAGGALVAALTG